MKAFAYVNPTSEKDAVAALKGDGVAMPLGGGQDLLARMKDYIDPARSPSSTSRTRSTRRSTATPDGGLKIGAAVKIVDLAEQRAGRGGSIRRSMPPAIESARRRSAIREPSAATSTSGRAAGTSATKSSSATRRAARAASPSTARTSTTPSSATRGRATSSTRRAWRCRSSPTARSSASSDRTASARSPRPTTSRCRRCRTCSRKTCWPTTRLLTHVILPAPGNVKSGHYEVRYKQSHDWPLAFTTVVLAMNGNTIASARVVLGAVAPVPWRSEGRRARAGRQAAQRSRPPPRPARRRSRGEADERQRLQGSDREDGGEARRHARGGDRRRRESGHWVIWLSGHRLND